MMVSSELEVFRRTVGRSTRPDAFWNETMVPFRFGMTASGRRAILLELQNLSPGDGVARIFRLEQIGKNGTVDFGVVYNEHTLLEKCAHG